jgi:Lrp/AsnC family transcriptional regulator for asnA, asnC and gidA
VDPSHRRRAPRRASGSDDAPARTLDALDLEILDLLRSDARLSTRAIARELGVAAGTIADRVGRLEDAGVIQGYAAILDPARLGRPLGFVIGLQITQGNDLSAVLDELTDLPEVDDVFVVTGQWDLLVHGRVRDPEHLNELLIERLWRSPSFRHSETMLVIDHRRRR